MSTERSQRVCPVERSGGLDNSIRKFLQNPNKILKPYIHEGMTVLDLGCGPGVFTLEIAKLLNGSGKVIAADLQDGMLDIVKEKVKAASLESTVKLHKCQAERIGIDEMVDFILAFYVIHEIPDHDKLFNEFKSILKPDGSILIVEPKFHVSKNDFKIMLNKLKSIGFEMIESPKVTISRTALMKLQDF